MASNKELSEEAQSLIESIDENMREIELAVKSGDEEVNQELTTHLTSLKRVRLELRLLLKDNGQGNDVENKIDDPWEIISKGRKLLEEQKKIIKNR